MQNIENNKYSLSFIKQLTGELVHYNSESLAAFYLEYFNNFLTIDGFAEYYNLTRYEASKILDQGKKAHNDRLGE